MPTLIIPTDDPLPDNAAQTLARIEAWFAARRQGYRILSPETADLLTLTGEATAIVGFSAHANSGARRLSHVLRQLPAGSLSGKPFLWFQGPAAAEASLGQLWLALQHAGIETVLKPVMLSVATGATLSIPESRWLSDGLVALDEGIAFCQRQQRKKASLDLSERFALASLLA